ncbi:hypothetical protein KI387_027181, partial [Taxus chinensis]
MLVAVEYEDIGYEGIPLSKDQAKVLRGRARNLQGDIVTERHVVTIRRVETERKAGEKILNAEGAYKRQSQEEIIRDGRVFLRADSVKFTDKDGIDSMGNQSLMKVSLKEEQESGLARPDNQQSCK